jgi:hypothetical protein
MFTAYVDESGAYKESPHMAVGGVIADAEKWKSFENCWREVLSDADVPYSHMKDFSQSKGPFSKWSSKEFEPLRRAFMKGLCDCIVSNVAYTFGAIITRKHYEGLVPADLRKDMGSPYTFLGRYCIARVAVWAQDNSPTEPINIIFERGQPQASLRTQHNLLSANEQARTEYRLGLLSFADKFDRKHPEDTVLPLQAADLVAYELLKHWNTLQEYSNRLVKDYIKPDLRRYPLKRLMELPKDWNKLTAFDIAREVRVWKNIRDYAKAFGESK